MTTPANTTALFPIVGAKVPLTSGSEASEALFEDSQTRLFQAMALPLISLTPDERIAVERERFLRVVMDSAGVAPMRCSPTCPVAADCSLYQIKKAPYNSLCPFEADLMVERFLGWMRELGQSSVDGLLESERAAIGLLCATQLKLQRCQRILARPENADLSQMSVRDVDADDGTPICYEYIVHIAAQLELQLSQQMRAFLKDFELTPEAKTRRVKSLGLTAGDDLASRQTKLADSIRASKTAALEAVALNSATDS